MSNVVPFYPEQAAAILERLIVQGDLADLTPQERAEYYLRVCNSVGLNPLTQPFDYIKLNGKLKLYALKGCTDQLRKLHRISLAELSRSQHHNIFVVTARAQTPDGRTDTDIGCVSMIYPQTIKDRNGNVRAHPKAGKPLQDDDLANAMMKAATKAKRRATLAICGLGLLDETEIETIYGAERITERPPTVAPAPKRRLEKPQTIDARYEAIIRVSQSRKTAFPRNCERTMADRDAEEIAAKGWPNMRPTENSPASSPDLRDMREAQIDRFYREADTPAYDERNPPPHDGLDIPEFLRRPRR